MTRLRADALLLICALIWGTAFVAQKQASSLVSPMLFVGLRFALSAVLIAPLALHECKHKGPSRPITQRMFWSGVLIGICVCTGSSMQQWALTSTTATNGGFLTAVYVVFVPIVVWLTARRPPRRMVILACLLSLTGAWLLAQHGQAAKWNKGDMVLLASDLAWALQITLVSRFMVALDRPFLLCLIQYAVAAFIGAALSLSAHVPSAQSLAASTPSILYTGLASGGIGFTLQILAQRCTPAAEAALIMSLESVFAAIAGAIVLHERLTPLAAGGCALILLGVLVVELSPGPGTL